MWGAGRDPDQRFTGSLFHETTFCLVGRGPTWPLLLTGPEMAETATERRITPSPVP